jgi:Ca2+-transporting ATPase
VRSVESEVRSVESEVRTYIKGAPEIVLAQCTLTAEQEKEVKAKLAEWQSRAMRTLAFACEGELLGIVAISDPVREDVPAAVQECQRAGIRVVIVTGDTMGTAQEIARQCGVAPSSEQASMQASPSSCSGKRTSSSGGRLEGATIASMTDEELLERAGDIVIVARARPMDKKRLVEALQARGEIVAVTGDGTNDAPALKTAHVGLSMGDGTAVAKEASDITIIDNSFASIGRAVMWGRSLYRNIQRFILFQMTVNVVACLIVLIGAFFDTQSPLTVTQMLWVNLIMDTFAAMALASLPPSEQVMRERPRDRRRFIISTPMWQFICGVGLAMTAVLLLIYILFEQEDGMSEYELSLFFTIFVMLQFWNLFNAKAFLTGRSAFAQLGQSKGFLFIVSLIFVGQILIVQLGGEMFNVVPLSLRDWLLIIINTSSVFLFGELWRGLLNSRTPELPNS